MLFQPPARGGNLERVRLSPEVIGVEFVGDHDNARGINSIKLSNSRLLSPLSTKITPLGSFSCSAIMLELASHNYQEANMTEPGSELDPNTRLATLNFPMMPDESPEPFEEVRSQYMPKLRPTKAVGERIAEDISSPQTGKSRGSSAGAPKSSGQKFQ
jgi:hypothetical protein